MRKLWNPATAVQRNLVLGDDVHPTSAGYALMVGALTAPILHLVRERRLLLANAGSVSRR